MTAMKAGGRETATSRVSATAARLLEGSWLAAIVVVPIFFNVHSARSFEGDKIPLLRSIALVMLVALIVRGLEEGRSAWNRAERSFWRLPLMTPAFVLSGAYVLATVFSIAPRLSLWGSYERLQGLYSWSAYVTIFVAITLLVRTRAQRELIVTVSVLTSIPMAGYTIVQHFGRDPIRWAINVTERAHGTTGNAIFLSGFMIMVVPLTLVRMVEQLDAMRARARGPAASAVLLGAYSLTLTVQLLAIAYSNSRGPMVGFGGAMVLFCSLLARQRGARRLGLSIIIVSLAGLVFLASLGISGGPLSSLRRFRSVDQLADRLAPDQGSARVRTLIWEGITQVLAARPLRVLSGYGPETLFLIFPTFYPVELAHFENLAALPDRAHNAVFDALTMTGVAGCAAELLLMIMFFSYMLGWLGLIRTAIQRRLFGVIVSLGALLGVIGPYAIERSFRFSGLGVSTGIVGGVILYLLVEGLLYRNEIERTPCGLLQLGLLAAVTAHFVEIQFGIPVSMTQLLFWVFAGLAVAVGLQSERSEPEESDAPSANTVSLGLVAGLIALVLTFNFYTSGFDLRRNATQIGIVVSAWLLGAALASADANRSWLGGLRDYVVTSVGLWGGFSILLVQWLSWRPPVSGFQLAQTFPIAQHTADTVAILYGAVGVFLVMLTLSLRRVAAVNERSWWSLWWRLGLYAILLLAAVPVIVTTNLNVSRADVFSKQAESYLGQSRFDAARILADEALRLRPQIDHYAADAGTVLMGLARMSPPSQREPYLTQALAVFQHAERTNPLNMDNLRNLARLEHLWATMAPDATQQAEHYDQAERYYERATMMSPNNISVWNEWALLSIERKQVDHALALIERSLQIDGSHPTALWIRGNVLLERHDYESALVDFRRATQLRPKLLAAWSGMGLALTRLGRLDEAIGANRRAARVAPGDLISHRNLALLYQQTGRFALALDEAQVALSVAPAADQPALKELLAHVQAQLAANP